MKFKEEIKKIQKKNQQITKTRWVFLYAFYVYL